MGRQGAYLQSQRTFQSQPLLCLAGTAGRYHHHRLCCAAFWKGNVARTGSEIAVAATDTASAPLRLLTRLLADREVDPANAVTLTNEVLIITMGETAHYALVQIGIDTELSIQTLGEFFSIGITGEDPRRQHLLGHRFISPPGMPIFKEIDQAALHRLSLTFAYPSSRPAESWFYLTTSVQTAGYAATENWVIHHRDNVLRLRRRGRRPDDE